MDKQSVKLTTLSDFVFSSANDNSRTQEMKAKMAEAYKMLSPLYTQIKWRAHVWITPNLGKEA